MLKGGYTYFHMDNFYNVATKLLFNDHITSKQENKNIISRILRFVSKMRSRFLSLLHASPDSAINMLMSPYLKCLETEVFRILDSFQIL